MAQGPQTTISMSDNAPHRTSDVHAALHTEQLELLSTADFDNDSQWQAGELAQIDLILSNSERK